MVGDSLKVGAYFDWMETNVTISEAARNLAELVHRALDHREETTILEDGRPVARLVPVTKAITGKELAVLLRGDRPRLTIEEAEAFEKDVQESRKELSGPVSPWD